MEKVADEVKMDPKVQEMFTLKHNGKLQEVGYDELIALAQKGLDYDRIRTDRDDCREKLGMLDAEFSKQSDIVSMLVQELMEAEKKLHDGANAYDEMNGCGVRAENEFAMMGDDGFYQLLLKYPEAGRFGSFEALPQGFVEGLEQGCSPVEAWQEYLLGCQQLKLAMLEQDRKNQRAAAPNVRSSSKHEDDSFVKALFGM